MRNPRGSLLEEFAVECGLTILNTTNQCKGRNTRGQSAIDYILVNRVALAKVRDMHVNEMREITAISDHNLLSLRCSSPRSTVKPPVRTVVRRNNRAAAQQIVGQLERNRATVHMMYENLRCTIERELRQNCQSLRITDKPLGPFKRLTALERVRKEKTSDGDWPGEQGQT